MFSREEEGNRAVGARRLEDAAAAGCLVDLHGLAAAAQVEVAAEAEVDAAAAAGDRASSLSREGRPRRPLRIAGQQVDQGRGSARPDIEVGRRGVTGVAHPRDFDGVGGQRGAGREDGAGELGIGAAETEVRSRRRCAKGTARALAELVAAKTGSGLAALGIGDDGPGKVAGEELVGHAVGIDSEGAGAGRSGDVRGRPAGFGAGREVLAGAGGTLTTREGGVRAVGDRAAGGSRLEDAAAEDAAGPLDLTAVLVDRRDHLPAPPVEQGAVFGDPDREDAGRPGVAPFSVGRDNPEVVGRA
jgi:hypothetical protein